MFSGLGCCGDGKVREARDISTFEFALYPILPLVIHFNNCCYLLIVIGFCLSLGCCNKVP